jgi:hypothetical protein
MSWIENEYKRKRTEHFTLDGKSKNDKVQKALKKYGKGEGDFGDTMMRNSV